MRSCCEGGGGSRCGEVGTPRAKSTEENKGRKAKERSFNEGDQRRRRRSTLTTCNRGRGGLYSESRFCHEEKSLQQGEGEEYRGKKKRRRKNTRKKSSIKTPQKKMIKRNK